jgi:hypothetical protein
MDFVSSQIAKLNLCYFTQSVFIVLEMMVMIRSGPKNYMLDFSNIYDYS